MSWESDSVINMILPPPVLSRTGVWSIIAQETKITKGEGRVVQALIKVLKTLVVQQNLAFGLLQQIPRGDQNGRRGVQGHLVPT